MKFPKFAVISDGEYTIALLDGVVIGEGIRRLEFSTSNESGEMRSTVRVMDLDVKRAKFSTDKEQFLRMIEQMGEE